LYQPVDPVNRGGKRRAPEEDLGRLVEVGQRRAGHAREHREAHVPRRQRGHGAHDRQAGQPVGHGHLHEARGPVPLSPVRGGVECEVRKHAEGEGGQRATRGGADHRTRQHVIGDQHVV